jgi:hypothetical protein
MEAKRRYWLAGKQLFWIAALLLGAALVSWIIVEIYKADARNTPQRGVQQNREQRQRPPPNWQ